MRRPGLGSSPSISTSYTIISSGEKTEKTVVEANSLLHNCAKVLPGAYASMVSEKLLQIGAIWSTLAHLSSSTLIISTV